jgi:ketosteroid isomerase-like protein
MKKENSGKKEQYSEQKYLAEIEKLHKTDRAASIKGDFSTLISLLTDDCVLLPPDSPPIAGKEAILEYFDAQKDLLRGIEITEYVHDFQEIKIFGKWAYEWGYFSNTARPSGGGELIKGKGKLFRILELQDDSSWKVFRSIWNIDTDSEAQN